MKIHSPALWDLHYKHARGKNKYRAHVLKQFLLWRHHTEKTYQDAKSMGGSSVRCRHGCMRRKNEKSSSETWEKAMILLTILDFRSIINYR